jgi:hypothetical protein
MKGTGKPRTLLIARAAVHDADRASDRRITTYAFLRGGFRKERAAP